MEAKTKKKYEEFLAVKYRNQIVKGTKYAIKVTVVVIHIMYLSFLLKEKK